MKDFKTLHYFLCKWEHFCSFFWWK